MNVLSVPNWTVNFSSFHIDISLRKGECAMYKGEPGEWNYKTGHGSLCNLQKKYSPLLDKWCYHCGEI